MQLAMDGNFNLAYVQQCQLWKQVATIADISNPMGLRLEQLAFQEGSRESSLAWPEQGSPSAVSWGSGGPFSVPS